MGRKKIIHNFFLLFITYILTGCFADKTLVDMDIDRSKQVTKELTTPIVLQGEIPYNITFSERRKLLGYVITNSPIGYKYSGSRSGYQYTRKVNYYCKSAHRKFNKIYRYEIEYGSDGKSIVIKNQSYCPICYSGGSLKTLEKKDEKKLCTFETKEGKEVVQALKSIRMKIEESLYPILTDYAEYKKKIGDVPYKYDGYFYYKKLNNLSEKEKIERTKKYLVQKKQKDDKLFEAESKARTQRVNYILSSFRSTHSTGGYGGSVSKHCIRTYDNSISVTQSNRAKGKGIGKGIALGTSQKFTTRQESENYCKKQLNIRKLDCITYNAALQACASSL